MKFFKSIAFVFVGFCLFTSMVGDTAEEGDKLIGVWEPSNKKVKVKIDRISGKYYGKIVWLREPIDPVTGKPKTDKNNPDESLKNVPLKGFRLLKDFVYVGDGEWNDGTIYDPQNKIVSKREVNFKPEKVEAFPPKVRTY